MFPFKKGLRERGEWMGRILPRLWPWVKAVGASEAGLRPEPLACPPSRKYASVCCACEEPIIPSPGRDAYQIVCLGRHFHEDCYRCEVSGLWSPSHKHPKFLAVPLPPAQALLSLFVSFPAFGFFPS